MDVVDWLGSTLYGHQRTSRIPKLVRASIAVEYTNKSLTVEQGMAATEPESRVSSTSGMLHIIDTEALLVCS